MRYLLQSSNVAVFAVATVLATLVVGPVASAQVASAEFEGWHLEPGVGSAHLVMVARVSSISRVTVVEGAKTDVALREYRFQPVRLLKGLFQRDELSMTGADLGISADEAFSAPPLQEGEFRLLILAQQQPSFGGLPVYGCVSAAPGAKTFDERVPLVTGPDHPLVGVVETLIRVADSRSRRERARLLIDRLAETDGLSAVPLLTSLRLRADWAATDGRAYAPMARLAGDPQPAIRGAAMQVLRDMLASRSSPDDLQQLDAVAEALREMLQRDEAITQVRVDALTALAHLLALKADYEWPRELLIEQLTGAATYTERVTTATALSRIANPAAAEALLEALAGLPLDETTARELVFARAAVRSDARGAERVLLLRLERSIAARQSLDAEIDPLSRLRIVLPTDVPRSVLSKESLLLLLAAAGQLTVSPSDRQHIARALGRLGDDRAVAVLTGWLRSGDYQLKEAALSALEQLDSPVAAREVRPLLKSESHLPYKLRIARLLARHGLADGYALATEHLADSGRTIEAALVLAALDDPRTAKDLSAILAARPDRRWRAAALTGLAAIGDAAARKELLEILGDDRHPLAADAAAAAGIVGDVELLAPLARLVQSRNNQIARASLLALRRYLSDVRSSPRGLAVAEMDDAELLEADPDDALSPAAELPAPTRAAIAGAVASLVVDAYVEADIRQEALAVARRLRGERFAELLSNLADQAELEGTPLLAAVQAERRRLRGLDEQP